MTDLPTLPSGARIRAARRRDGRAQAAIAGLCGISTDYLSKIERGLKKPSGEVLVALAAELQVKVATLLGDPGAETGAEPPTAPRSTVVQALLQRHDAALAPLSAAVLRPRVEQAWKVWQTSARRFTEAEALLPDLIGDVEGTVRALRAGSAPTERREVLRVSADLYGLLRSYYRRIGRLDLSLMAADRALRAAEDADDPLRMGAARWNLGHVLLAQPGSERDAVDVAMDASRDLAAAVDPSEAAAVRGALELVAVVADARARRPWAARERLTARAVPLARRSGESNRNSMWTVFGPTNVALHALSVEMTNGDAVEGLRLADQIDVSALPSRERRFTFGLEVARCYDLRRDDAAVLVHLLELEQLAPEDLERSPLGRQLVVDLLRRVRPTYRQQATGIAERLHLV
ncbi:helix-turn-helix transcriptional regulator [Streptomyces sp. MW-W600-10]|uniref:helix-turn-helix domain-containing protein n=1 Tax=Streptomyces sp. MW-W600-10 TaxID=2829819 RepID=UPI001C482DF5|nr:helix-turn-helix transcriptional regulator [Streptomyces sp. MW-W600-10]MBV7249296.1 helix-turn-helix transcriptional regulator [Streptomyces sp. MW-W600-10]